jgi:hypothetical protein
MPTVVTVGLSRKLSKDFQSQGFTLSIQSELPATAVQDPETMARATQELYQLAEDLIDEQVRKADDLPTKRTPERPSPTRNPEPVPGRQASGRASGQSYRGGGTQASRSNGNSHANGQANVRGITDAQARALDKMARAADTTAERIAHDEFGVAMQDLTVRQASQLIDQLKQSLDSANSQGVRR